MAKGQSIAAFDLVGAAEIAEFLGISKWQVYELVENRRIPVVRMKRGSPLRARSKKLLEWIEENEQKACCGTSR